MKATGQQLVDRAKLLIDVPYLLGAKANKSVPPEKVKHIDCSGLVTWVCRYFGIPMPDGSFNQIDCAVTKRLSVEEASRIPGALFFHRSPIRHRIDHVVFSDGYGGVIEATPPKVRHKNPTRKAAWFAACIIKGVHY